MKFGIDRNIKILFVLVLCICICISNILPTVTITADANTNLQYVYYVKSGVTGGNGTQTAPFSTISKAVDSAVSQGLSKGDYLVVKVLGEQNVEIGTLQAYDFTLEVQSAQEKVKLIGNTIANGKTIYKNVSFAEDKVVSFGGSDVELCSDVELGANIRLCDTDVSSQTVILDCKISSDIIVSNTYFDFLTVRINNSRANIEFKFDDAKFKNAFNIYIKDIYDLMWSGTVSVDNAVQFICQADNVLYINSSGVIKDYFNCPDVWYILNTTDRKDAIDFSEKVGEFSYIDGYKIAAVSGSKVFSPKDKKLTLPADDYEIEFLKQGNSKYSNYINQRGKNLSNTFSKIKSEKSLNVVYFGGSLTSNGVSNEQSGCWRERVEEWFENCFPNTEINSINASYDMTGTRFGAYRLEQDVLSQNPDLVFIEFSVDDYYDDINFGNNSDDKNYASMCFETIVRQIRKANPTCDIVTILTSEKSFVSVNKEGKLHKQAQEHEDLSIVYDIPSIHVGRALSDMVSDDVSNWNEYAKDEVYLGEKGNEVYYSVIEEYLSGQLIYSEYNTVIENHIVADLVNSELLDGDICYIDADEKLLETSNALGGSGFEYIQKDGLYRGAFEGGVTAKTLSAKFCIEFVGTELAVLSSGSASALNVIVDGQTMDNVDGLVQVPKTVVSGLDFGKHTVEINPVSDDINAGSFLLHGFFTRDETKATKKCVTHQYGEYSYNNDATCKSDGTETAKCEVCGYYDTRISSGTKLSHILDTGTVIKEASCEELGEKVYKCTVCGQEESTVLPILEHKSDEGKVTRHSTCKEEGEKVFRCTACNEVISVESIPKLNTHRFDSGIVEVPSTCKAEGKKVFTCLVCGLTEETTIEKLEDHEFDNGKQTQNPTCKQEGIKTYTCVVCGKEKQEKTPKLTVHTYTNDCDSSCNICGLTRTIKHNYKTETCTQPKICAVCGAKSGVELGHSYIEKQIKAPTCKEAGYKIFECSLCGSQKTETLAKLTNHTYTNACDRICNVCDEIREIEHNYDDATCTKAKTCKICGKSYGSALGHNYDKGKQTEAPTCAQEGVKTFTCSICGDTQIEQIDKLKTHTYENNCDDECDVCGNLRSITHSYSQATCTKPQICEICGLTKGEKLGHEYNAATCTQAKKCKRCEKTSGAAKGHTYDSGKVTKKATCGADGVKTFTCSVCKVTKTEKITKLSHNYKTKYKKANAESNGKSYKQCELCDKITSEKTIYKPKTVKLSTTEYTYNGKTKKPSVTVLDSKGKTISSKYYTIERPDSSKKVGQYTVKVKFKTKYSGSLKAIYKINPKATTVSKVTAGKKSLKLTIKKQSSQTTGYEIEYSTSKKFSTAYTKVKKISSYKTTFVTLSKLKENKTYYIRVRTYKTISNKKFYSAWSKVVSKKTK